MALNSYGMWVKIFNLEGKRTAKGQTSLCPHYKQVSLIWKHKTGQEAVEERPELPPLHPPAKSILSVPGYKFLICARKRSPLSEPLIFLALEWSEAHIDHLLSTLGQRMQRAWSASISQGHSHPQSQQPGGECGTEGASSDKGPTGHQKFTCISVCPRKAHGQWAHSVLSTMELKLVQAASFLRGHTGSEKQQSWVCNAGPEDHKKVQGFLSPFLSPGFPVTHSLPHLGQKAWIPSRLLSSWWKTDKTYQWVIPEGTATAG